MATATAKTTPEPTALAKVATLDELDTLIQGAALTSTALPAGQLARTMHVAAVVRQLRDALTDEVMADVMSLQGTAIGFRTDKDNQGGYPLATVRDCLIEGLMRGAYPAGNEINIIGGRAYFTREYFSRIAGRVDGLTDLREHYEPPKAVGDRGALVKARATWRMHGVPDSIDREIPIRVNAGQGADAILGKASRKLLAAVLRQATGSETTVPDGDVDDPPMKAVKIVEQLTDGQRAERSSLLRELAAVRLAKPKTYTSGLAYLGHPPDARDEHLSLQELHALAGQLWPTRKKPEAPTVVEDAVDAEEVEEREPGDDTDEIRTELLRVAAIVAEKEPAIYAAALEGAGLADNVDRAAEVDLAEVDVPVLHELVDAMRAAAKADRDARKATKGRR